MTTDSATFQDILNKPIDDIKAPVALPMGTYLGIIDGQPEQTKIGKNETPAIIFQIKPVQAGKDVDQTALLETLNGSALQDKKIRHTMFVTPDSAYRLKEFLVEHLGIDAKPIIQMLPEAMGKQVFVTLGHKASDDGKQVYNVVKGTAKV
ncbi:MAG TPA: hypothetical protein VFV92_03330 [Candidatus Bathyarchaeia archaeon]|nr:hypothetical protein [Candidatus Bathyarchaeia archaeon]